VCLVRGTKS